MKIQCDVCDKEEASVFCTADEAALCDGCDRGVHHANKLAGKHLRFSLLSLSFKDAPRCDICQEKRAFLFCREDRSILCRECDISIHKSNEHTQKHNRFLLTGVKLSFSSSLYSASSSSSSSGLESASESVIKSLGSNQIFKPTSNHVQKPPLPSSSESNTCNIDDHCSVSTSSISEYLMETLPGWRFEDFLDPSCPPHGFCKTYEHGLPYPLIDHDDNGRDSHTFSSLESLGICVPQAPPKSTLLPLCLPQYGVISGHKGSEKENNVMKVSRKWSEDVFTVPHISPPPIKKSRQLW